VVVVGIEREHEAVLLTIRNVGNCSALNERNLKKNGSEPTIGPCWPFRSLSSEKINCHVPFCSALGFGRTDHPRAEDFRRQPTAANYAKTLYRPKWEEVVRLTSGSLDRRLNFSTARNGANAVEPMARGAGGLHFWNRKDSAGYAISGGARRAEYRLKDFPAAKSDLRAALRTQPKDQYTLDFLGTIYLLEGNLEAALKYWNNEEKPRLARVTLSPNRN